MKLGIMQPYIFPYIGYFQLINAVNRFVVYDDVTYIKQGWINRNNILLSGQPLMFTVPLRKASSFTSIAGTSINMELYNLWVYRFEKTLMLAYSRAPYYKETAELVMSVFNSSCKTISELAVASILATCKYLDVNTEFVLTSSIYHNNDLKAQQRVIDICKRENAATYLNAAGGKALYSKDDFKNEGLELKFLKSRSITYNQIKPNFVPWLSIIDVLMFNSPGVVRNLLNEYDLE
jgi:WbqC-like protein family